MSFSTAEIHGQRTNKKHSSYTTKSLKSCDLRLFVLIPDNAQKNLLPNPPVDSRLIAFFNHFEISSLRITNIYRSY